MINLYDRMYDELYNRFLRWKARLYTKLPLSAEAFIDYFHNELAWILESMWMLIRINHEMPNENIDKFKKTFNEMIIIFDNTKLRMNNTRENRKKIIYDWAEGSDLFASRSFNKQAMGRLQEEGIKLDSEAFKRACDEFIEEFDNIANAMLDKNLEYVNTI